MWVSMVACLWRSEVRRVDATAVALWVKGEGWGRGRWWVWRARNSRLLATSKEKVRERAGLAAKKSPSAAAGRRWNVTGITSISPFVSPFSTCKAPRASLTLAIFFEAETFFSTNPNVSCGFRKRLKPYPEITTYHTLRKPRFKEKRLESGEE